MNAVLCQSVKPFTDPRMDEVLSTMGDAIRRKMAAVGWISKAVAMLEILIRIVELWTMISALLDAMSAWFGEAKTAGEMVMHHECRDSNSPYQEEIKENLASLYSIVDSARNKITGLQSKLSQSSIPPYKILRRIDALLEDMDHFCLNLSIAQDDELQELAARAQAKINAMS
ncbi:MAG: hypothetical protein HQM03_08180 [Magnetococcales bacterium]|nr:hypothetical protein [Magnetococcales bacterium]